MSLAVDHLIYAVPDLEAAIDFFDRLTGVRPVFGGQHPGRGSHNALISLGGGSYLEIIAPDPTQPTPDAPRSFALDRSAGPRFATWAVRTTDIERTVAQARAAGYDPGTIFDGARQRSDGLDMKWRLTRRPEAVAGDNPAGDWLIPFVIDWGETPHPSASSPAGVRLAAVRALHPDPAAIRAMVSALGLDVLVEKGSRPQLWAELETPNGRVIMI